MVLSLKSFTLNHTASFNCISSCSHRRKHRLEKSDRRVYFWRKVKTALRRYGVFRFRSVLKFGLNKSDLKLPSGANGHRCVSLYR
ncbi:hypothetical protein QVD17_14792 [Tagetes erecta]|uniref:Uncharacterized protein n=1 Tax=Tagetes erecta TaxID=13708 RepID=A0AAD8NY48_TARER|nr:hypothetical protein QVD17_14792 [Tagetes erecta]